MRVTMVLALLVLLSPRPAFAEWPADMFEPYLRNGCTDGPPIPGLNRMPEGTRVDQMPPLTDVPMSGSSLRFIITPDSYRGDGLLMVQLDSGLLRSLEADGQPLVIATVGNWRRTCTVRLTAQQCPQAEQVREQLVQMTIPVGYGMESITRITLHSTRYTLQFYSEQLNTLSYWLPDNPLQQPLEQAKEALRGCWQAAYDAAVSEPGSDRRTGGR